MDLTIDDILGHDAGSNVAMRPECGTCGRALTESAPGVFTHQARIADYDRLAKENEKVSRQARADALLPYAGAIEYCQASVVESNRGFTHSRCTRAPKWVRKTTRYDYMAVCTQHGKAQAVYRYTSASPFDHHPKPADESIEKEFTDALVAG